MKASRYAQIVSFTLIGLAAIAADFAVDALAVAFSTGAAFALLIAGALDND